MKPFNTTRIAGAIAAGGASQQIAPRNPKRDMLLLQNPKTASETLFYAFGEAATTDGSCLGLEPGEHMLLDKHCAVPSDSINVNATTTGHKYVLVLGQLGAVRLRADRGGSSEKLNPQRLPVTPGCAASGSHALRVT
jgi:hypothetical protein